jgi:ribosomal protein S4
MLPQIHTFLDEIAAQFPTYANVFSIGTSTQGRDMKVIKIGGPGVNKPTIWVDCGKKMTISYNSVTPWDNAINEMNRSNQRYSRQRMDCSSHLHVDHQRNPHKQWSVPWHFEWSWFLLSALGQPRRLRIFTYHNSHVEKDEVKSWFSTWLHGA